MEHLNRNIRILIHDHQDISRAGITLILSKEPDFQVIPLSDSSDLLQLVQSNQPDVVFTSAESKQTDIVETVQTITGQYPHIGILVISAFHHDQHILNMLRAGATGYVIRNAHRAEIVQAIRHVAALQPYYSPEISARLANIIANKELEQYAIDAPVFLTDKEKLFIKLLCYEHSLKDIAGIIGLSVRTLEHKKQKLYEKLGKQNLPGLINYAILTGLYNPYELNR
jgi:DNA-binding NarL/FixJ family response regulator